MKKEEVRLHPESWAELRRLIKLHGAPVVIRAICQIEDMEKNRKEQHVVRTS